MTEKTKTSTLATNYNALTLELRASVIRYFKRQVKKTDIKDYIIKEATRYSNPFLFGRDNIGGVNHIVIQQITAAITEAEAITLIPPGQSIEEETVILNQENTCLAELPKLIKPIPNLKEHTKDTQDVTINVEDLAAALYEILQAVRNNIINDGIIHAYKTQKPKKGRKQSNKIRISTEATRAIIGNNVQNIDLFDQLLPSLHRSQQAAIYAKQNEKGISTAKQTGFNFSPIQTDILTAVWELIAKKSNTTNAKDAKTFYTGEDSQKITTLTDSGESVELISPGIITTWAELTKHIYGSASKTDKDKIKNTVWELWKDPRYHPVLHYPINQYKKGSKTITRMVTTWEPVIKIEGITDINDETGERVSADGTVRIFINPVYAANISNRYQHIDPNYLERRRQIGQELNTKAPKFLTEFYQYINNARSYAKNNKSHTHEVGLFKNSKGAPGLYYILDYDSYKKNRHEKRFQEEFIKAIEYLKRFNLITEYQETKDATGLPMGVFTFKLS
jgi:hypothetical protein